MPRTPAPRPPTQSFRVYTPAAASAAGVSTERLRARDLRRLGYGIYARTDFELTEVSVLTALTRSDPMAVVRGLSAARHWGFPLPMSHQIWVTEPRPMRVQMTANGQLRRDTKLAQWNRQRLRHEEIVADGTFRVTTRVRTWLDLALVLSFDRLVEIGDHLVRIPRSELELRDQPYATPQQLRAAVRDHPGPGKPLLRKALELIRVGSDSPAETRLRLAALRAGLPPPVLNIRQFDQGHDLGEPDLAWPEWRICIEHDGPSHRTPAQQERDIRRRERREARGWIEVQTVAADLHHGCDRGIRRLKEALVRRGWRPGSTTGEPTRSRSAAAGAAPASPARSAPSPALGR